jgi:hypothetical protein
MRNKLLAALIVTLLIGCVLGLFYAMGNYPDLMNKIGISIFCIIGFCAGCAAVYWIWESIVDELNG